MTETQKLQSCDWMANTGFGTLQDIIIRMTALFKAKELSSLVSFIQQW